MRIFPDAVASCCRGNLFNSRRLGMVGREPESQTKWVVRVRTLSAYHTFTVMFLHMKTIFGGQ